MALYLLDFVDDDWDYEMADGFVVRAPDTDTARDLAAAQCGVEGPSFWRDPAKTTCKQLDHDGDSAVILRSFLAG
jgi:hypothetical protein